MDIVIRINTDSDAFAIGSGNEVARILDELVRDLGNRTNLAPLDGKVLRDYNGNTVGNVTVEGGE